MVRKPFPTIFRMLICPVDFHSQVEQLISVLAPGESFSVQGIPLFRTVLSLDVVLRHRSRLSETVQSNLSKVV